MTVNLSSTEKKTHTMPSTNVYKNPFLLIILYKLSCTEDVYKETAGKVTFVTTAMNLSFLSCKHKSRGNDQD